MNKEREFLVHLITLIREGMSRTNPASSASSESEAGRALAYHEVGDYVVECSRVFEVPLSSLGIDGFDPEKVL